MPTSTTTRTSRLLVVVVLALLVTAGVLLVRSYLSDPTCGSPPTQEERSRQEAFVTAHLPDARDFAWTVMDCDENGQVVLAFTTRQTGTAATRAFLQDPACQPSTEPDASAGDAACHVGRLDVAVSLDDTGAIDTTGELTWTPT